MYSTIVHIHQDTVTVLLKTLACHSKKSVGYLFNLNSFFGLKVIKFVPNKHKSF